MSSESTVSRIAPEDYQAALRAYAALNDTPMQRLLRERHEWFVAAVYWQPGDYDIRRMVTEFRRMRELGFTAVRFHSHNPTEIEPGHYDFRRTDDWMNAAAEAGISAIFHQEGASPSDAMLAKHGISRAEYDASNLDDPRHLAAIDETVRPIVERYREHPALYMWVAYGEPGFAGRGMDDPEKASLARWLEARYGSVEALDRAWNLYPEKGKPIVVSFGEAWRKVEQYTNLQEIAGGHLGNRVFGAARDMMRWHTDRSLARAKVIIDTFHRYDSVHPVAVGSHQLFLNQPMLRWDVGQWARLGDLDFASIHLSWHFEHLLGEVDRGAYLHAKLNRDYFKNGWCSAYETTGGAVQYSGGYGNAMTPGLMRRLTLGYLAAGNINLAFWTWNHRPGGFEGGEYGLTTLSGEISSWAREVGKVARGLSKYATELWEADAAPRVGLVKSWDTEAVLVCEPERYDLDDGPSKFVRGSKAQHARAYIGAARAMINAKLPFEFVTSQELLEGIALRYPTLYLPHTRAISVEVMERLIDYVNKGGRLVADVQIAFDDPWGKLHPTGPGGIVERAFGAYIDTIHDARTAPRRLNDMPIEGFYGDLKTTTARVLARFDTGEPAITEARFGKGQALLMAFDPARMCFRPGNVAMEGLLASLLNGQGRNEWECDAPMAFRLSHRDADHYFLLNDGAARAVVLKVWGRRYVSGEDVLEARSTSTVRLPSIFRRSRRCGRGSRSDRLSGRGTGRDRQRAQGPEPRETRA